MSVTLYRHRGRVGDTASASPPCPPTSRGISPLSAQPPPHREEPLRTSAEWCALRPRRQRAQQVDIQARQAAPGLEAAGTLAAVSARWASACFIWFRRPAADADRRRRLHICRPWPFPAANTSPAASSAAANTGAFAWPRGERVPRLPHQPRGERAPRRDAAHRSLAAVGRRRSCCVSACVSPSPRPAVIRRDCPQGRAR